MLVLPIQPPLTPWVGAGNGNPGIVPPWLQQPVKPALYDPDHPIAPEPGKYYIM